MTDEDHGGVPHPASSVSGRRPSETPRSLTPQAITRKAGAVDVQYHSDDSEPRPARLPPTGEEKPGAPESAWCDLIGTDPCSPDPACRAEKIIPSSAKVAAWHLINCENSTIGERKLFALVDAVACLLAHGGRYRSQETARLALETVVGSAVALAATRCLVEFVESAGPMPSSLG